MSDTHTATARSGTKSLSVSIVTPEGLAFEGDASTVVVPGHDGEVAFLSMHAPYVGALGAGELRVTPTSGPVKRWFLEGGVAEVNANVVVVLADRVIPAEKIDVAKARTDLAAALAIVATEPATQDARARALRSARARLAMTGSAPGSPAAH